MPEMTYQQTARAFYDTLQHTQWLPPDELQDIQRQQLSQLLRHAAATSPFYGERLSPVVDRNGQIYWDRWHEIPVLTRDDLQAHRSEILSRDVPAHHGDIYAVTTSGTTGQPVTVSWTGLATVAREAAMWRMQQWHNFDWSAVYAVTRGVSDPWPEGQTEHPWYPPWHNNGGARFSLASATPYPRIAEWVGRKRPKYFSAIPMTMPLVVEAMIDQKIENTISCMIGFGGQASPLCRKLIRDALGIPVLEIYSAEECGQVAHECPFGSLHILSELVVVEILDENNQACAPGTPGRVIVTVVHNAAQPTIRYEIGDVAAFAPQCECGRSLPVLSPVAGRIKHHFRFAGEQVIAPNDGQAYEILENTLRPSWYQIAQTGPLSVEVRFVSQSTPGEADFHLVREQLPSLWRNARPDIVFKQLATNPLRPGRKHIVFVNEWEPSIALD